MLFFMSGLGGMLISYQLGMHFAQIHGELGMIVASKDLGMSPEEMRAGCLTEEKNESI
jgi:hypothetical protein